MSIHKLRRWGYVFRCAPVAFVLLAMGAGYSWSEIIPSSRRTTWQGNVGVLGEIINRSIVYATVFPNGVDDTAAIQNAIDNCPSGKVVRLSSGTFNISRRIKVKSEITLRGAGMEETIIRGKIGSGAEYLIGFENDPDYSFRSAIAHNISGNVSKGSNSITTSVAHGWAVGDLLLIDQLEDPSGDPPITSGGSEGRCTWCGRSEGRRPVGQLDRVVDVSTPTRATLEVPLYQDYNMAKMPQAIKLAGTVRRAGIEELTVDNTLSMNDNQYNYGTVFIASALDSWLYRVAIKGVWKTGIRLYGAYRNTIRGCMITESHAYTSDAGYGIFLGPSGSANLFEDNILSDLSVGFVFNGAVSGNVFAYNYVTKMSSTDFPAAVRPGISAHGAHSTMNLFEGNYFDGPNLGADFYWGSSACNTFLRNRQITDASRTTGAVGVILWKLQRYYNFVGNVLGTNGVEMLYSAETPYGQKAIYCLDYTNNGAGDGQTEGTILRHGNYDFVTDAVVWDPSIDDHGIPPSLYLSRKPDWWGGLSWPVIGPDVIPMGGTVPARARYKATLLIPRNPRIIKD
jgi:hypothetical protein